MAGRVTERQREIVQTLASGKTDKEIAAALGISVRCVRSHITRCRERVGARSREELIALAVRANFWHHASDRSV